MRHLLTTVALTISMFLVACGTAPSAPTTDPIARLNDACEPADARTTINGVDVVCMRNSVGNLAWTESQPQQQSDSMDGPVARVDGPCETADARMNIDGTEVVCMRNSVGNLAWQSADSTSNNTGFDQVPDHAYDMVQVGMACDSPGNTVFMNELYVCKNGA